ncbi:MAG: hypothetical protein AAGL24_23960 [Pseudomonadota bacterium]
MRPSLLAALGIMTLTGGTALAVPPEFNGRAVVVLSDGAMLASGYIDGRLGPRRPDLLSLVPLDPKAERRDVGVSNSVATWPNVMAMSADGRFAIVTEPFGQPPDDASAFADIPRGNRITVVDVSTPDGPRIVQQVEAPGPTAAVDIHPSGTLVAVTLPFDGQIAFYPLDQGRLGEPVIQDLGIDDLPNSFVPEFKWHPSGQAAALTLGGADRVVFYRFDDGRLTPWGEPLRTAPLPGKGMWTSDGRHFIVTTITATGDMAQIAYGQNTSLFAVFAFDADDVPNSPPRRANDRVTAYESASVQHARLGHVPAGMGYVENFALSPDGRWIVGLNMAASWLPENHPGRTEFSELTLFGFDPTNGRLTPHGVTRLHGVVLPQGIVFDADGSHVAVTSFQHDDREGGSLSFWRLSRQGQPRLEQDGEPVSLPRGAHLLHLVQ